MASDPHGTFSIFLRDSWAKRCNLFLLTVKYQCLLPGPLTIEVSESTGHKDGAKAALLSRDGRRHLRDLL